MTQVFGGLNIWDRVPEFLALLLVATKLQSAVPVIPGDTSLQADVCASDGK